MVRDVQPLKIQRFCCFLLICVPVPRAGAGGTKGADTDTGIGRHCSKEQGLGRPTGSVGAAAKYLLKVASVDHERIRTIEVCGDQPVCKLKKKREEGTGRWFWWCWQHKHEESYSK